MESVRGQGEVLALQASLFQVQLELQASQRAQRQATGTQEDLSRALQRLENDLRGALQYRRETQRHNQVRRCDAQTFTTMALCVNMRVFDQELQLALEKARSALQEREEQLREGEQARRQQDEEREATIRELRASLLTKEQLVEVRHTLADCYSVLTCSAAAAGMQILHMLHIPPADRPQFLC